jgi:hypothetical protein
MTKDWLKLPVDEIRMLRGIKNRLAVIQALNEDGALTGREDLRQWMDLRDRLP